MIRYLLENLDLILCYFLLQALVESLLLSGGTPYANFKDLAYAWGRERNFHLVMTATVCERRGEIQRKKRCDVGKTLTEEQKQNLRDKRPHQESSAASNSPTAGGGKENGVVSKSSAAGGDKKNGTVAKKPRTSGVPSGSAV